MTSSTILLWHLLQPACDCYIRTNPLTCAELSPFSELEMTSERFNAYLRSRPGGFLRLLWKAKPFNVKMFEFEATSDSETEAVLANYDTGVYWFKTSDNDIRTFGGSRS